MGEEKLKNHQLASSQSDVMAKVMGYEIEKVKLQSENQSLQRNVIEFSLKMVDS